MFVAFSKKKYNSQGVMLIYDSLDILDTEDCVVETYDVDEVLEFRKILAKSGDTIYGISNNLIAMSPIGNILGGVIRTTQRSVFFHDEILFNWSRKLRNIKVKAYNKSVIVSFNTDVIRALDRVTIRWAEKVDKYYVVCFHFYYNFIREMENAFDMYCLFTKEEFVGVFSVDTGTISKETPYINPKYKVDKSLVAKFSLYYGGK